MRRRLGRTALPAFPALMLALALAAPAAAQDRPWFGECTAAAWSGTRNLDDQGAGGSLGCLLQLRQTWSPAWRGAASLRLGEHQRGNTDGADAELREAMLEWQSERWTLRAGRATAGLGAAPTASTRPTSCRRATPRACRRRTKTSAWAPMRCCCGHFVQPGLSLTAVAARFRPHRLPTGSLPPDRQAAALPSPLQTALRLERTGGDVDWALTAFDGHTLAPSLERPGAGPDAGAVHRPP